MGRATFIVVVQLVMVLSLGEEEPLLLPSAVERIPVQQAIKSLEEAVEEVLAVEKFCNKYYSVSTKDCRIDTSENDLKAMDCAALYNAGIRKSGIYTIHLRPSWMTKIVSKVYCDMETDGGGWTVIQRRGDFQTNPPINFTRNYQDYSRGFGNLEEEFWLGNENIYRLTSQDIVTLRVNLLDFEGKSVYAQYDSFEIGGYKHDYILRIGKYTGNAGDSLIEHNGTTFDTYDYGVKKHCANSYKGGWWYGPCHYSNLNGINFKKKVEDSSSISWYYWKRNYVSNKWSEMKIRPKKFSVS